MTLSQARRHSGGRRRRTDAIDLPQFGHPKASGWGWPRKWNGDSRSGYEYVRTAMLPELLQRAPGWREKHEYKLQMRGPADQTG